MAESGDAPRSDRPGFVTGAVAENVRTPASAEPRPSPTKGRGGPSRPLPAPPAPIVGSALSGFVVGILLTLLLTGVLARGSRVPARSAATLPTPSRPVELQMYTQIKRLVLQKLGPSDTNQKTSRLISLHLLPVDISSGDTYADARYRTVAIVFRLYDHPLGPAWRVRAAKADVFAVMKALYSSGLPVYDTEMQGRFPLPSGKQYRAQTVLDAFMSYRVASRIPWKHWARDQEGELWNLLPYKYIDSRFS